MQFKTTLLHRYMSFKLRKYMSFNNLKIIIVLHFYLINLFVETDIVWTSSSSNAFQLPLYDSNSYHNKETVVLLKSKVMFFYNNFENNTK